jgi:hypothetical protein
MAGGDLSDSASLPYAWYAAELISEADFVCRRSSQASASIATGCYIQRERISFFFSNGIVRSRLWNHPSLVYILGMQARVAGVLEGLFQSLSSLPPNLSSL